MNVLSSDKVTEAWLAYLENQSLSYVQEKTGLSFPTVKKLVEHGYARTKTRPFAEKLAEFTQALEKRVTEEALETPVQAVTGAIRELLLAREEFRRAFEQLAEMDYKRTKDPVTALVSLTNGMLAWCSFAEKIQQLTGAKPADEESGYNPHDPADIRSWSDDELDVYCKTGVWPKGRPLPK